MIKEEGKKGKRNKRKKEKWEKGDSNRDEEKRGKVGLTEKIRKERERFSEKENGIVKGRERCEWNLILEM